MLPYTARFDGLFYMWSKCSGKLLFNGLTPFRAHRTNSVLLTLITMVVSSAAVGQVYLLDSSNTLHTFNTCSGTFYDSGSSSGNYANNEDYTITFCSSSGDPIIVDFSFIDIESGLDYLHVFDGPSEASPQLAGSPLSGSSAPTFTSSGTCITFVFTSDGSAQYQGWEASILCSTPGNGGNYNNPGDSINTCSGSFFDTGGSELAYGNNQDIITTFCADEADQCLSLSFDFFELEPSWDSLKIYDGPSIESPLIGSYTGVNSPGIVTGTGSCLSVRFTSDASVAYPGWEASIGCSECDTNPPGGEYVPACPSIQVGYDQALDCATPCTDLTADVTATGMTMNYEVSAVAYDPPYPFIGGTPLFLSIDDVWSETIDLPFNFCFYGNVYSQIVIGANGLISFNTDYANAFCPWQFTETVPDANLPLNAIFGAYHDLDPSVGGNINYQILGTAPCRTLVVNYNSVAHYICNSLTTTQQIVIYEATNIIDVYVLNKEACSSWNDGNAVIGIQDATGATGLSPPERNSGPWTASNEAWRFTPNGPPNYVINWYDENNTLIGNGPSVNVCPDSTTTYTGEVVYQHCDGSEVIETDEIELSVYTSYFEENELTICAGDSVVLGGEAQTEPGEYTDIIENLNGCDSMVVTELIVLEEIVVNTEAVICEGESILLEGEPQTEAGTYTDVYESSAGCDSLVVTELTVHPTYYMDDAEAYVCPGDSVFLGGDYLTVPGAYTDVFQSEFGCDSIVVTTLVAVENPEPEITFLDNTLGTSESYEDYQWYFNGAVIEGATGANHTPEENGEYSVVVTDVNGCEGWADGYAVISVGVEDLMEQPEIVVHPNPTSGVVHVVLPLSYENVQSIQLVDMTGRVVNLESVKSNPLTLDLSGYSRGTYSLRLMIEERVYQKRIVLM